MGVKGNSVISPNTIMNLNLFPHPLILMMLFRLSCFYSQLKVQVYLKELTDVCSLASKRKEYTQIVEVAAESTRPVPFIIIPMKHGKFPIEVKASVGELQIEDGIRKQLLVVVSKQVIYIYIYIYINNNILLLHFCADALTCI